MGRQRALSLAAVFVLSAVSPALAQETVTARDVAQSPGRYYGQEIIVTGTVAAYQARVSPRGNPFATFRLEAAGASAAVFAWGKFPKVHNGSLIRVRGKFTKVKRLGRTTFANHLEALRIDILR